MLCKIVKNGNVYFDIKCLVENIEVVIIVVFEL